MTKFITRLDAKHINALAKGKTVTLNRAVHDGGQQVAELSFKTAKHSNALSRSLGKGKGKRIKSEDLDDVKIMNGSGVWDSIKNVANSKITKGVAKALAPEVGKALAGSTGNPLVGAVATGAINAYAGSGVKKRGRPSKSGGSFFQTLKAVAKPVAKAVAPIAGKEVGRLVAQSTGNQTLGNIAGAVTNEGLKSAGSGIKKNMARRTGGAVGAVVEAQAYTGISPVNVAGNKFQTPAERMSWVRSHRKKGGSFAPLG
jgi:hypothetical protein